MCSQRAALRDFAHLIQEQVVELDVGPICRGSGKRFVLIAPRSRVLPESGCPETPVADAVAAGASALAGNRGRAAGLASETLSGSARQTGASAAGASPARRRRQVTTSTPSHGADIREGEGQALTGAHMGRAIEHRKSYRPRRRGSPDGRRQHPTHRYGEGGRSLAVSKNPRTYVRTAPGPGRSPCHPACRCGIAEERGYP